MQYLPTYAWFPHVRSSRKLTYTNNKHPCRDYSINPTMIHNTTEHMLMSSPVTALNHCTCRRDISRMPSNQKRRQFINCSSLTRQQCKMQESCRFYFWPFERMCLGIAAQESALATYLGYSQVSQELTKRTHPD